MPSVFTPPNTIAQTSHALVIRVIPSNGPIAGGASDTIVGAVNEWQPAMTRALTDLFAFGAVEGAADAVGPGEPFEVVPGNVGGLQISLRRWDLFNSQLETAFTGSNVDLSMLSAQLNKFRVQEVWSRPDGTKYRWTYEGCWFADMGRQHAATNERTVNAGGTIRYTRRRREGSVGA